MPIRLDIPTQCDESWDAMQPNKDGRHCLSCQKTVVDFSNMTDKEILDYISNARGSICGRLNNDQLGRELRENNFRRRFSWRYIWNLLIFVFVFAGKAKAQGKIKYEKVAQVKNSLPKPLMGDVDAFRTINGVVRNAMTNEPVPFASVMVKGTNYGVSTDSAGNFKLEAGGLEAILEISSAGFETAISKTDKNELLINLSPATKEMDKVEIVGYGMIACRSTTGLIATAVRTSYYEKITREFKKDIVVFPNPTEAGSSVQVSVQLQEKGEYRLDLIDGSGKLMWMKTVNIAEPTYNLSIPTESKWSAGIYWLRITGRHTRKIYNGKIVLQ